MAHEKSETVKIGKRWFNRDTVGPDKGRVLGNKAGFSTMKEAEGAAERRSRIAGTLPRRKPSR